MSSSSSSMKYNADAINRALSHTDIKETYGAAVGASNIEQAGRDQAAQGDVEQKAAQASEYAAGLGDNLGGKVSLSLSLAGGLTG